MFKKILSLLFSLNKNEESFFLITTYLMYPSYYIKIKNLLKILTMIMNLNNKDSIHGIFLKKAKII
jgi:hypothetical protein